VTRISAELEAAQTARVRETGMRLTLSDERVNLWEWVAGQTIPAAFYRTGTGTARDVDFEDYRGSAGMCILSNGHIVRVRNGDDEDQTDRQIWVQEITDPTDPAQWEAWTVLYSGTHYSASVQPNGTSYKVYHSKAGGGIYINNVLKVDPRFW
jgi:hypothetical protein